MFPILLAHSVWYSENYILGQINQLSSLKILPEIFKANAQITFSECFFSFSIYIFFYFLSFVAQLYICFPT